MNKKEPASLFFVLSKTWDNFLACFKFFIYYFQCGCRLEDNLVGPISFLNFDEVTGY